MRALSLEGGGILGAAEAGMIKRAMETEFKNYLVPADVWPVIAGTSIGCINGLMIALRMSGDEIFDTWNSLGKKDMVSRTWSLFYGLYSRKPMQKFLENLIEKKMGTSKVTFKDIYKKNGVNLMCTGTVVQTGETIVFGKDYFDYNVVDSIMMSTSFPIVFIPSEFVDPKTKQTYQIIDGGVLMNTPILPLMEYHPSIITVLTVGSIEKDLKLKGFWTSSTTLLSFFCLGNELASLGWADLINTNCVDLSIDFDVYSSPCAGVSTFDWDKIKQCLNEGVVSWDKGKINIKSVIDQYYDTSNVEFKVNI